MSNHKLSKTFLAKLEQVTGKRSRIVVDHILEYGFITTEDLEKSYGYKHPPRAVKDVRDQGIPIDKYSVKSSDGRTIAAYRFGDPSKIREGRLGGRITFSKRFKKVLYDQCNVRCVICNGNFSSRELQIDHRIPYKIAGNIDYSEEDTAGYMLLCGSCNRAKSWSCKQCSNWHRQTPSVCHNCYWAQPTDYVHVATQDIRQTEIRWQGEAETDLYDQIVTSASKSQQSISDHIKTLLKNIFVSIFKI